MKNYTIRNEVPTDYRAVENMVREAFWNVYRPGCLEHYVLHQLRNDPAFVPELDFVMEKGGQLIGQNMFMRAVIKADDGRDIPIMTMGPICITPHCSARAMARYCWTTLWNKRRSSAAGHCASRGILLFTERAGSHSQAITVSAITDCRRARMHHSFCAGN